jgi:hypothetical protein
MRRFGKANGLSLFFLGIFLLAVLGQAVSGHRQFNQEQAAHDGSEVSLSRYVVSSDFGGSLMENWESEFLQFTLFTLATIWLFQRGSPESKKEEDLGWMTDAQMKVGGHADERGPAWAKLRGWRSRIYENSLLIAMAGLFLLTWFVQSLTNWTEFNDEQTLHGQPVVRYVEYLREANFWERTFQNWQSEFLAVGTLAIFTVYLRQRGSPESKRVGAPHDEADTAI